MIKFQYHFEFIIVSTEKNIYFTIIIIFKFMSRRCLFTKKSLYVYSSSFSLHQTAEYGNCWTISSDKFVVGKSGPGGGKCFPVCKRPVFVYYFKFTFSFSTAGIKCCETVIGMISVLCHITVYL